MPRNPPSLTGYYQFQGLTPPPKAELSRSYEKQKVFYSGHKPELEDNVFWKPLLAHHNGFPSWEEYQSWMTEERDDRYYAIFPLVVLSWRDHRGHVPGNGIGTSEYHIWYILGSHLLRQQLRRIE